MEKKIYEKPVAQEERFIPNMFVAACPQPTHWKARCRDVSCLIFEGAGPNDWTSDMNRGGCNQEHEFVLENGKKPEANCWLLKDVRTRTPGTINIDDYKYLFTNTGNEDGSNWKLKPELVDSLKAAKALVPGYYNDHLWHDFHMLVTDDIANIKNPS